MAPAQPFVRARDTPGGNTVVSNGLSLSDHGEFVFEDGRGGLGSGNVDGDGDGVEAMVGG